MKEIHVLLSLAEKNYLFSRSFVGAGKQNKTKVSGYAAAIIIMNYVILKAESDKQYYKVIINK